jgi:hypothetical protein
MMRSILLALLLTPPAANPTANPPADPPQGLGASYQTAKTLTALEQCLTDSLSKLGDVTSIQTEGTTTLMLKTTTETPMLIDLAPPKVTVTTKFSYGTRSLVKACL